jgi:hypothetical protein
MGGQNQDAARPVDERVRDTKAMQNLDSQINHTLVDKDSLHIIQQQMKGGGTKDEALMKSLGLPSDPFSKEWTDPGEKGGQKLVHQIEQALGIHHTIEDKAREREVANLPKDQKKKYDDEETALKNWEMGSNLNAKRPDTPMHDQVEQNVGKFEQQAKDKAIASLTPEERQKYEAEQKANQDNFKKWLKNPEGPMPEDKDGPMTKKVNERTQQNAEKDLIDNPTGAHPTVHHPGFHPGEHRSGHQDTPAGHQDTPAGHQDTPPVKHRGFHPGQKKTAAELVSEQPVNQRLES